MPLPVMARQAAVDGRAMNGAPGDHRMAPDNADHSPGDTARVPVVEERARLDKRDVVTGRVQVRIRNEQHTERLQADLRSEVVEVERVAIGRELAVGEAPPVPREAEDGTSSSRSWRKSSSSRSVGS